MNTIIGFAEGVSHLLWVLSWQVGVLILLVWAASLFFRGAAPNFKYWLWCIVLIRLCLPATLLLPWGVSGHVRHAVEATAPEVLPVLREAALSAPPTVGDPAGSRARGLTAPDIETRMLPGETRRLTRGAKLGLTWMGFSLCLLVALAAASLRARRMIRRQPEITRPELLRLVDSLRSTCGIRRRVVVRMSASGQAIRGPAVVGIIRPTILLPAQVAESWGLEEIEPVLLHEFAHIRRWDLLLNWIQMVVQALYFFHPLVWFANARIRSEREQACDDLAVHLLRGQSKRYSRSFVRVIEEAAHEGAAIQWGGVGMTERRKPLASRIVRMMSKDYRLYRPLGWLSTVLLVFVFIAAVATAAERALPEGAAASEADTEPRSSGSAVLSGEVAAYENGIGGAVSRVISLARSALGGKGGNLLAGAAVLLVRTESVEPLESLIGDDGSFTFGSVPAGTYFITVKPQGREAIASGQGGWRLIDLVDGQTRHVILNVYRWEDKAVDDKDAMSLDVAQLREGDTWSSLPDDLRRQAEEGYAAQRANWLGLRRVAADYRWTTKRLERGQWVQEAPRTGTMAYEMIPVSREEALRLGHPLRMQIRQRVHDNELQWNAVSDDVVSGPKRTLYWQDGHESEPSSTRPKQGMWPSHWFTKNWTIMGGSYDDALWQGSNIPRESYFKGITPAIRLSTDEETQNLLGGEKCYMFFAWLAQPRVWISAATGKIHQLDMWNPGRPGISTRRYTDYVDDPATGLCFPSRVVDTWMEGSGAEQEGVEQTVELTEIRLNPELPPETFHVPPQPR